MAVMSRLLPLVAYTTFAIFLLTLMATPANALAHESRAHVARGHESIAKRKRNPVKRAKRCRPQTTSLVAASTSTASTQAPVTSAQTTSVPVTTPVAAAAPTTTTHPATTKVATSSTHSSSAVPTTSVSVSTGGGSSSGNTGLDPNKKLLLAWTSGPTNLEKFGYGTRVGGMYTWSPWCPDNAKTIGVPCFQQLWGEKQKSSFTQQVGSTPSTLIFGFNEPNQGDQSNMSAQDGATLWNTMIKPLKREGAKLVSPACTSAPSGKTWIQDMMKACGSDKCGFDFLAIHWYGTSPESFKAYVDDFWKTFNTPLIVSEYACQDFSGGAQCTKQQTIDFHHTMATWLDQHEGVAMYAPFGFMPDMGNVNPDNQLMGSDGGPNELGNFYLYH
ncbi:unnamed protein product [Rhizoctonia solani]|uniref:Asl1-like glycosyl hydrolase catalytic domain-containing protein n=1 Tax=Rhizoctonia solani TaxID=456999 RepID=A0A8H2Y5E7_9AGAM|nr:unnamed protein product [Rhizoctonia solani]CAE6528943.1 unnamed protein product [Rhizoctonia solani]